MSDDDGPSRYDGISLREYVDMRFRDHERLTAKDTEFYSKEMHDIYAAGIAEELRGIRKDITDRSTPTYWWIGALAIIASAFGGIWYLSDVIARLDAEQKHTASELSDHNKQMEVLQHSLDRLIKPLPEPDHPPTRR